MILAAVVVAVVAVGIPGLAGCNVRGLLTKAAIRSQSAYFSGPGATGAKLERLTSRVWTFNWHFDRTLVIDTDAGLVVLDPFTPHLTAALRPALAAEGLRKPVHTLIYSHHHLDHVKGGGALEPGQVLAHEKCPVYWADQPVTETDGIARPTRLLTGNEELLIGGVRINLLHLGASHTDTLYAVHLPDEGVLYLADMVGVRVLLPGGGVALYSPGYLRALDRLAALEFDRFVPSHFGHGSKRDFLDAIRLQHDLHDLVRAARARHKGPTPLFTDAARLQSLIDDVLPRLRDKYGSWHGFEAQALSSIFAAYTAQHVGE